MSDDIPTRLLIVDDIPTMLQTLRYALEDQGFEVVASAADGQEALNLLKRERGEYEPKLAPVNLVDLTQRVMRDLQPLARADMGLFEKGATFGKEDGSGLGTYSAKLMAEVLGGSISFISSEKERTCFSVSLPAHHGR